MDTKRSKYAYLGILTGFLLFMLIAVLYSPVICSSDVAGDLVVAKADQKNKSVSSFLDRVIGERDETAAEPNETIDEPDLFEDSIWYAGTWDSTLYLKAPYPRTVAVRMTLLDKETHQPIRGAGVSLRGEYRQKLTGPGDQSQVDLSIFHDLRKLQPQQIKPQQRKFALDAISDSNGLVVFSLNRQIEYSWQAEAEDEEARAEGDRAVIHPNDIECVASWRIRHPEYKEIEIPVVFKGKGIQPLVLELGEKFPDFNNKRSRRIEFYEKIRAEDSTAYRDVKDSDTRANKTKCGPYLVYDMGEVPLVRTAPRRTVRRPVRPEPKEVVDTPKPRPDQPKKPPEKTAEPKDVPKKVEPEDRVDQERTPDQKTMEQPEPAARTAEPNDTKPEVSQIDLNEKIVNLGDGVRMRLRLIPEGTFQMGSPPAENGRDSDEGPVHEVRINEPFYMGVHEVTQEQYEKVMKTNPSKYVGPNYPVHMVSWDEAQEFCQALSRQVGGRFRLPTEAEWEYACRAGTTTAYYWGAGFDDRYAWSLRNSGSELHEVGTRLPNAYGLYDMSGNLWEWCEDAYEEHYPDPSRKTYRRRSIGRPDRVLRGGSWNVSPAFSRSANRSRNTPDTRKDYDGFRVVLDVK